MKTSSLLFDEGGSVETLCIPPPPPYPTSTMRTVNNSLAVPEVTITSSCISENDSEAPLLNSMTNSDASSQATTSLRTRDLKMNLRKQKEMLRKTGSKFQCSEAEIDANSSLDSNESFRSGYILAFGGNFLPYLCSFPSS